MCSSSAASGAIARHNASLGSEAGQGEQAFVHRRQGFRRPPLGDFLEAYPKLVGSEGLDGDLPRRGRHQLGGGQHAIADELVHGRDADAEPVGGRVGADRLGSIGICVEGEDAETFAQPESPGSAQALWRVRPKTVLPPV